ncbi:MAG: sigma-70 family RNA polymerase sigma factor, partial [Planctomycetota bacterium]
MTTNGHNAMTPEELLAHVEWIRRFSRSLVSDASSADDIAQETWLTALKNSPPSDRPLKRWLVRVARNFARQRAREEGRRIRREEEVARPAAEPSPPDVVEKVEAQRLVVDAVLALGEPYRTTVLLHYFEDLSSAEISRRENVPEGTVRWRLKRGLDEVRVKLDARFGGDRRAWMAALAFLARPEAPAVTAGVAASLISGVLAMSTLAKILIVTACTAGVLAILLGAGLLAKILPATPASSPREEIVRNERESPLESLPAIHAQPLEPVARTEISVPEAAAAEEEEPSPARAVLVRARFLSREGSAIQGVRAREVYPPEEPAEALSGEDGRVELRLRPPDWQTDVTVSAAAPGFATRTLEASLGGEAVVVLGDITLDPGGSASGHVVDSEGRAVAEADVFATDPELRTFSRDPSVLGPTNPTLVSVSTREDGSFTLEGIPEGFVRIWSRTRDTKYSFTDPIEVRAGQETAGIRLTLEPLDPDDLIEGIVLAPDGSPLNRARVSYEYRGLLGSGSGSLQTGSNGRFRVLAPRRARYDLFAADGDGRFSGATATGVEPGTRDLVLRLTEPQLLTVKAHEPDGRPVKRFGLVVYAPRRTRVLSVLPEDEHEGGVAYVALPPVTFEIEVKAPGHAPSSLGAFQPGAVPREVDCVLVALPGIAGRVTADGGPVEGARVLLLARASVNMRTLHNGFAVKVEPGALAEGQTDASGSFRLDVVEDGLYFVRAEADGFAPAEIGPFEVRAGDGARDLALLLSKGGTLEVQVLTDAGLDPSGKIVAISRGDARAVTARTDASGRATFVNVMTGPWLVLARDKEILADHSMTEMFPAGRSEEEIPSNCEVLEGKVTRYVLDLRASPSPVLQGRFTLLGSSTAGWTARLLDDLPSGLSTDVASCPLDSSG